MNLFNGFFLHVEKLDRAVFIENMGLWALRNKEYTEKIEHQNVNVNFVTVLGSVNPLRSIIEKNIISVSWK